MKHDDLKKLYSGGSQSFQKLNQPVATGLPSAKPESRSVPALASGATNETGCTGRVRVTLTAFRCRLQDPDNAVWKWTVDCLRHAGYVRNDTEQDILLDVRQIKVETKEQEGTLIELNPQPAPERI